MQRSIYISKYSWDKVLSELPSDQQDIFQQYEYYHLWGRPAFIAVVKDGTAVAALPYLMDEKGRACSPYGFSGPYGNPALFAELAYYIQGQSHMFVLNPFLAEQQRCALPGARHVKDVVYADLTAPEQLRKGHAAAARRAEREGAQVTEFSCDNAAAVAEFARMYAATMERLNAAARWRFSPAFFAGLKNLGSAARIFFAILDGRPGAGCLVLQKYGRAYYHLAGSYDRYPGLNHLMVLTAMRAARARGMRTFCLGGGLTPAPDDPLLRFKAGFSPLRAPVWVADGPLAAAGEIAA